MNPSLLVENSKSIIVLAQNYYPETKLPDNQPYISYYAYGQDYHDVIKKKLKLLFNYINDEIITITGRFFVDSAPVLERYWAVKSGIGFIGKNSQLIIPGKGSFFFLSELIIDLELDYDKPFLKSLCGKCTRCIDNCPTKAIEAPYFINSKKCISYLTIENKSDIPSNFKSNMKNRIFGCDTCQTVCPHNRFAQPNTVREFDINPILQIGRAHV